MAKIFRFSGYFIDDDLNPYTKEIFEDSLIATLRNESCDCSFQQLHIEESEEFELDGEDEPNVSPVLYTGRKEKAEVIIAGFEELEQYRALGTVKELKAMMDNGVFTGIELAQLAAMQMKLKEYQQLGTVEELREVREKQMPKKPLGGADIEENLYKICPCCSAIVEDGEWRATYCPDCGQKLDWSE